MVQDGDHGEVSQTVTANCPDWPLSCESCQQMCVMSVQTNRETPNYVTLLIFRGNIPREISWHHRLGIKWLTQAVKKQTFKVAHEVTEMCMNKII